jgi:hypothetical protein
VPEIVHITVNTPYPGTETWVTESRNFATRDYRLFDVQHAVLSTAPPLDRFYDELVKTQQVPYTYPIARPASPTPAHSANETTATILFQAGESRGSSDIVTLR